jgi:hypothetical protein
VKPADLAQFLAAARVIDDRILINQAMMSVWLDLLPDDLDLDVALDALRFHYRNSDRKVMPANVIEFYRIHKRRNPPCWRCKGSGISLQRTEDNELKELRCDICGGNRPVKRDNQG